MYPDDNILVGMNSKYFYFYSNEDDVYWHWECNDDEVKENQLNCTINVFIKE